MVPALIVSAGLGLLFLYCYDRLAPQRMRADFESLYKRLDAVRFNNWLTYAHEISDFGRKYVAEKEAGELKARLDRRMIEVLNQQNPVL